MDFFSRHLQPVHLIQHRRFYSGKAEIVRSVLHLRRRKMIGFRIPFFRHLLQLRPARVAETHGARHLVESLSRGIISGSAVNLNLPIVLYQKKVTVSSARHKTDKRRFAIRIRKIICRNMSFNMVYRNERLGKRIRQCLRIGNAHQKRTDQSRPDRYRNSVQIRKGDLRLLHCKAYHLIYLLQMITRGNFRYNSAKLRVNRNL